LSIKNFNHALGADYGPRFSGFCFRQSNDFSSTWDIEDVRPAHCLDFAAPHSRMKRKHNHVAKPRRYLLSGDQQTDNLLGIKKPLPRLHTLNGVDLGRWVLRQISFS
jgi:hypothetical protein